MATLADSGHPNLETEWIHVGHLQIPSSVACNRCWKTADFVRLITSRHIKCHLIGMIKLGKTRHHPGNRTDNLCRCLRTAFRGY